MPERGLRGIPAGKEGARDVAQAIAAVSLGLGWIEYDNRGTGAARTGSPDALRNIYRLAPDTRLFLTGTDDDPSIVRWWGLGIRRRAAITHGMREVRVGMTNL